MDETRTTVLADVHVRAGATMTSFAGWRMPVRYEGTLSEHAAVRSAVGVFDVSHLGTVWVRGKGALDVIDATFTNDPRRLRDGQAQYTLCCNVDGGVVDDLIIYRVAADQWLAIPNAANTAAVTGRLADIAERRARPAQVTLAGFAVLAVQGPESLATIEWALHAAGVRATAPLREQPAFSLMALLNPGVSDDEPGYAATTGYTGESGAELVIPTAWAATMWRALREAGATPCGLGARDTLRLEMGFPLYGNELSADVDPFTAGVGWAVKLDGREFVGSDALVARKAERASATSRQRTVGLVVAGRRPARAAMQVRAGGREVGVVTSGTFSPTLGRPIALARLDAAVPFDQAVTVDVRGTEVEATVVRPPFIRR